VYALTSRIIFVGLTKVFGAALLVNEKVLKKVLPSQPVRIVGFKSLPKAGDPIMRVESEEVAEAMVERRAALEVDNERPDAPRNVEVHVNGMRSRDRNTKRALRVHELADIKEGDGTIRIPIIVKADADGSLSAIRDSLISLGVKSSHKVVIDPILTGTGEITASDIQMAKESEATIFAFGLTRIDQTLLNLAESEGVTIRSNDIIYSLLDEAKETLGKHLPREPVEHVHGRALVQAIFSIGTDSGEEKVAGLKVTDGHIYKDKVTLNSKKLRCHFRVFRDGKQISPDGEKVGATSLRRFKDLVESVRRGDECGLALTGFTGHEEGDEIECYSIEMKHSLL
jgi:translation initiation factor IF-2